MREIKKHAAKYLLIIIGLKLLNVVLTFLIPELYENQIFGEGFTQTKATWFSIYQRNVGGFIIAMFMALDLREIKCDFVIIPILCVISPHAGLLFFVFVFSYHKITQQNENQIIS